VSIEEIQRELRERGLAGWLFVDHHNRDPVAYRVLGLALGREATRRWYYLIPAEGEPRGLVHHIESEVLDRLPGVKRRYASWQELERELVRLLGGVQRVAMQYSPNCAIPQLSLVDAGTVEQIRALGVEVVSAADLVQMFEARWTPENLAAHLEAGRRVDAIIAETFRWIGEELGASRTVREFGVKQHILERFSGNGLTTNHGPIVASGRNTSNPHYQPRPGQDREIRVGDVLLLDVWAKLEGPAAVYYDVTWMAYCGPQPPEAVQRVFEVVREARERVIGFLRARLSAGEQVRGFEADDVARRYISECGYGPYFTHRTGHSIGRDVHGAGANLDNFETHDERRLIPWTCFSVEPGVYLEEFGARSEVNVFLEDRDVRVTGTVQDALVTI